VTVAVVVDSTADIPADIREELGITVVPLLVLFGNEQFRDGIDLSSDKFYARLSESSIHPTTSQPSTGDFVEAYERLAKDHDGIISIHLGGKLSGTVRAAQQAADMLPQVPIRVIDSGSVSMGLGFLGIEAAQMARAGRSLDEIAAAIEAMIPHIVLWAVLDTLKYIERGGRIGKGQAFLGTLLNVKPMIYVRGEVLPGERVRTHKKAIARMVELATEEAPYKHLAVLHSCREEDARELADRLGAIHARDQIIVAQLTAVIGVHGGPGIVGVTGIKAQ
jgi:DegV family protein with EDD domain